MSIWLIDELVVGSKNNRGVLAQGKEMLPDYM